MLAVPWLAGLAWAQSPSLQPVADAVNAWLQARAGGPAADAALAAVDARWRAAHPGGEGLEAVEDWSAVLDLARAAWPRPYAGGRLLELHLRDQPCFLRLPADWDGTRAVPLVVLLPEPEQALSALDPLPEPVLDQAAWLVADLRGLASTVWAEDPGRFRVLAPLAELLGSLRVDRNRVAIAGSGPAAALAARLAASRPQEFQALALIRSGAALVPHLETFPVPVIAAPDLLGAVMALRELPPREPYPLAFSHWPGDPQAGRGYWVQAQRFEFPGALPSPAAARLRASVQRERNTIVLNGQYVYQVDLYLNDRLVDLDQPLQIVRNGIPYRFQAERSLRTLLEMFARLRDPQAVFPVVVRGIDLPPSAP